MSQYASAAPTHDQGDIDAHDLISPTRRLTCRSESGLFKTSRGAGTGYQRSGSPSQWPTRVIATRCTAVSRWSCSKPHHLATGRSRLPFP